jgi:hypothetical protein
MAGANSNIQMTDLDFNTIKNNLKTYLQSQDTLKDYNYEGSALSVLLDVLAYNTQYNAYYLNMVANEMFLDSAIQRSSVVSQAKLLNYIPKSARAPEASINLTVNEVTNPTLTLPKYTAFMSEAIDGTNYNFVTPTSQTVQVANNTATFSNINIKQGIATTVSFIVNNSNNPKSKFTLPDSAIDTTTIQILVQQSSVNTAYEIYNSGENYLTLDNNSLVYFIQEGLTGNYEIYFGDGILGKKLTDGNKVIISYIVTNGTAAAGANSFVLLEAVNGYSNTQISPVTSTTSGKLRESIESIKFHAPKAYAAQKRAVTKEDYINAINQNDAGYPIGAVNVWGGQENVPPVYGQVFIAIKPAGAYTLTATQKQRLVDDVIKPISVMTVEPTIVDPDYTYLQLTANVLYDSKKTNLTAGQLESAIRAVITSLSDQSLNTFNSTFSATDFSSAIASVNNSIITNEISLVLQKKFYPNLSGASTYKFYYGTPLKRGMFQSGVTSKPSFQYFDSTNYSNIFESVYIEEVPTSTGGLESITVINPGFGYQYPPTVKILGDGTGATAEAVITGAGVIKQINVLTTGTGYTSILVEITPAANDTTGNLGAATATLIGRYGTLRTYYNDTKNVKTILNSSAGTIDYVSGVITLDAFAPYQINDDLGQLTINAIPTTSIISSAYNRIITIDPYDPAAIVVNVTAK